MIFQRKPRAGGGWPAVIYTLLKACEVGPLRLWHKMRSRNACKTCAVGMGGQLGGMVNEAGHFPEVCKKSLQAQVADMKGAIPPQFFQERTLADLLALTPKEAEDLGRLTHPLVLAAGADRFKTIAWQDALQHIASALKSADKDRAAFYSSGRSSNEAAFLLNFFARAWGSNNVMNCSFYCHQASGVALKMAFGTGTATVTLEDLTLCDLVLLVGANPASNHPRIMTQLAKLRERGGKVIVVNPLRESGLEKFHVPSQVKSLLFGSEIASLYVQPYAAGDVALFLGVLKALAESGRIDKEFLEAHAAGHQEVLAHAAATPWQEIVEISGVDRSTVELVAQMVASAKSVIFMWSMGLTHHRSGVDNVLSLANIAIATGNIGRPGAGMLPLRGHSNVQGVGSVGVTPALQEGMRLVFEKVYGKAMPVGTGLDTHSMIEQAERGMIDFLLALGGNLWGSNPNSSFAARALQRIPLVVYLSTKLNPGHFWGRGQTTIILPVLARDEEPQSTTQESMFNFVRLSDGGKPNVKGLMRSESAVILDLAELVLSNEPFNWSALRDHNEIRKLIATSVPGWEEIASIGQQRREFTIAGRILHSPLFNTQSTRAIMHVTPLPPPPAADTLTLVTLRSEGQFNTVVYEEYDLYRGVPHRHCLMLSAEDARRWNLKDGQRVKVHGEAGSLSNIELVIGKIRPGVAAMYYPEANILIKGNIDPRSKTPSFKSAPVRIEA